MRIETGRRHVHEEGESVPLNTYYQRRLAAGDLVVVSDIKGDGLGADSDAGESIDADQALLDALNSLEPGNSAHWTEGGKPDLPSRSYLPG